jgi:site-specific DNA-methyltransferase (adenine-specific)
VEVVGLFPANVKGGTWNRTAGARHFSNDGEPTDYQTSGSDSSSGSAARFFYCAKASKADRNEGCEGLAAKSRLDDVGNKWKTVDYRDGHEQSVMARNHHPTVKPTALMRYLCRLVTPPGGTVLDPFTGSGTVGMVALMHGRRFVGAELNADYLALAQERIGAVALDLAEDARQVRMFGGGR